MKRTPLIAVAVLALAFAWFYFGNEEKPTKDDSAGKISPEKPARSDPADGKSSSDPERPGSQDNRPKRFLTNEDLKGIAPTEEELKVMLETPVEFYGQVLDQHDAPVEGARISCSWPFRGPHQNSRKLLTDADGRFEVKNLKALAIKIFVYPPKDVDPPEGYQRLPAEEGKPRDIQIADPPERIKRHEYFQALPAEFRLQGFIGDAYKPDKTRPMVFRLQKLE